MTLNKCPYDYQTYDGFKKRVKKWQKDNPLKHKEAQKRWGLRSRALAAKKIQKNSK